MSIQAAEKSAKKTVSDTANFADFPPGEALP
jgi:hypothetical protein